ATPVAAADAFRRLTARCPDALAEPGALADYAETLVAAGEGDAVRQLLAGERAARADDEEARLHLVAGGLLADADNAYRARQEYQEALGLAPQGLIAVEARLRLGLLDAERRPAQLAAALAALAREPAPV